MFDNENRFYNLQQLLIDNIIREAFFVVIDEHRHILCPLAPGKCCVQLPMGKNWFWKVDSNSLILLSLSFIDCDSKCYSDGKLASDQCKRELVASVIHRYSRQKNSGPFTCSNCNFTVNCPVHNLFHYHPSSISKTAVGSSLKVSKKHYRSTLLKNQLVIRHSTWCERIKEFLRYCVLLVILDNGVACEKNFLFPGEF